MLFRSGEKEEVEAEDMKGKGRMSGTLFLGVEAEEWEGETVLKLLLLTLLILDIPELKVSLMSLLSLMSLIRLLLLLSLLSLKLILTL